MNILGIETSCDETAAAVVRDGRDILSNVIASQMDLHARYGGIVPEVASRQHLLTVIPIIQEAMAQAQTRWGDLDAIAVTNGPGLAGSLIVGVNIAKAIALSRGIPLLGVNHLEGHIYANWLEGSTPDVPAICLIVSGGHSDLLLVKGHGSYQLLGRTRDDAAGEAFDKVSRILGLGYPGGPAIEQFAIEGNSARYRLPRAWLKDSDDFSFSGLKTAVLHLVEKECQKAHLVDAPLNSERTQSQRWTAGGKFEIGSASISSTSKSAETQPKVQLHLEKGEKADIAASFQKAVVDVLVTKTVAAAKRLNTRQILLGGGVAANHLLRQMMAQRSPIPILIPNPILCTDNAAMIASCGYFHLDMGKRSGSDLDIYPNLSL
ncbi:MAG TPA: tRNA (adenosine(37)-N6)-threonylcarbamoyltransferase complex transferase subunit TsaD [Dehalococcoidia bacterium]|nr:tRNA (adenosine(37)-N6)-threonylcarbamoyltransferase complex transferase subunit TsaD [Dehalococcoidia bacterium]